MEWFIAVLVIAALGVAALAAAGGMGEMSSDPVHDSFWQDLGDAPLPAEEVRRVRFSVAFRGYSMRQVDAVLARLADEIAERDRRLAELQPPVVDLSAPELPEISAGRAGPTSEQLSDP